MATVAKETREVIQLVKALAKAVSDAKADGVINILDVPKVAPVIIALKAAVDGSDKIAGEIKAAGDSIETMSALLSEAVLAMLELVNATVKK
jgi:hypothetical protein